MTLLTEISVLSLSGVAGQWQVFAALYQKVWPWLLGLPVFAVPLILYRYQLSARWMMFSLVIFGCIFGCVFGLTGEVRLVEAESMQIILGVPYVVASLAGMVGTSLPFPVIDWVSFLLATTALVFFCLSSLMSAAFRVLATKENLGAPAEMSSRAQRDLGCSTTTEIARCKPGIKSFAGYKGCGVTGVGMRDGGSENA